METTLLLLLFIGLLLIAVLFLAFVYKRGVAAERKARLREQNLRYELYTKLQPLEKDVYDRQAGEEVLLYDGRRGLLPTDFSGGGASAWNYAAHGFDARQGQGHFSVDGNVLTISRSNAEGRFELHLHRYTINKPETKNLPKDGAKSNRRLRLQCEVKRDEASHGLRFVFKGEDSKEVLDEKDCIVFSPDWQPVVLYFNVTPSEPTHLRIDDLHVLKAPSAVQIRNLVLFEKA